MKAHPTNEKKKRIEANRKEQVTRRYRIKTMRIEHCAIHNTKNHFPLTFA